MKITASDSAYPRTLLQKFQTPSSKNINLYFLPEENYMFISYIFFFTFPRGDRNKIIVLK